MFLTILFVILHYFSQKKRLSKLYKLQVPPNLHPRWSSRIPHITAWPPLGCGEWVMCPHLGCHLLGPYSGGRQRFVMFSKGCENLGHKSWDCLIQAPLQPWLLALYFVKCAPSFLFSKLLKHVFNLQHRIASCVPTLATSFQPDWMVLDPYQMLSYNKQYLYNLFKGISITLYFRVIYCSGAEISGSLWFPEIVNRI